MTSAAEACLLIKWRDVAALSLRNCHSPREGQKYAYTGVFEAVFWPFLLIILPRQINLRIFEKYSQNNLDISKIIRTFATKLQDK